MLSLSACDVNVGRFHTWPMAGGWVVNEVTGALWEAVVETGEGGRYMPVHHAEPSGTERSGSGEQ